MNAYTMAVNNVARTIRTYAANDVANNVVAFDAFVAAQVLGAAFCKDSADVLADIIAASNVSLRQAVFGVTATIRNPTAQKAPSSQLAEATRLYRLKGTLQTGTSVQEVVRLLGQVSSIHRATTHNSKLKTTGK